MARPCPRLVFLALGLLLLYGCARGPDLPSAYDPTAVQSLRIPGGKRCLQVLDQLGVRYKRAKVGGGMDTPVQILSDIAGVRYTHDGHTSLTCDCRLALALHWSAPVFASFHVSEVEHYGAYVNRRTRGGRPSLHARGLALDAARFKMTQVTESVARDYARGLGAGCYHDAPAVNQLVCQLRELGLFRELITPDHDPDHHDHVHLAIAPL
jgi:hypothetical protein